MKYVIHHHVSVPDHYDLMLERGDALHTWRIPAGDFDSFRKGLPAPAEKIQDHRKSWLGYEGPVCGDRGTVELFDKGVYDDVLYDPAEISVRLKGGILRGTLLLKQIVGERYTAQVALTPGPAR